MGIEVTFKMKCWKRVSPRTSKTKKEEYLEV